MKIIQSFWQPSNQSTFKGGFIENKYHLMSWALSCLSISKYYPNMELVCDEIGYELLIDKLQLPYKTTEVAFGENDSENKIWTLRKLSVYSKQTTPFLHIDGDVYLYKKLNEHIELMPLIAQNEDNNLYCYDYSVNEILSKCKNIPEELINSVLPYGCNAGVIGGQNFNFFKMLYDRVLNFLDKNIDFLQESDMNYLSTFLEQGYFYTLSRFLGIKVQYLFDQIATEERDLNLQNFYGIPNKNFYVHLMASKKNFVVCEQLAQRLKLEYPIHYERCVTLATKMDSSFHSITKSFNPPNDDFYRTNSILSMLGYTGNLIQEQNYNEVEFVNNISINQNHHEIINDIFLFELAKKNYLASVNDEKNLHKVLKSERATFSILKNVWNTLIVKNYKLQITNKACLIESEWSWVEANEFNNYYINPIENLSINPGFFKTAILIYPNSYKVREFSLDPFAIILTDILENPKSVSEIIDHLKVDYQISALDIEENLEERLKFLLYNHLIQFSA